jgi:DNA-binding response OmpR family regulator
LNTPIPTIVLIENDDITLELYQRELCKSFKVIAFTDMKGVLEVITTQDIRAVIIEPEIHSGNGWDLIHSIHETFPDRFIPVLVCTTRDRSNMSPSLNVTKYLTKPVLPRTLREKTLEMINEKDN